MLVVEQGNVVERGQKGELLVRGYSVMRSYWDNEEQTKMVCSSDRWYHTG